ncbi:ferredoxin [Nocardia sp. SYP-A9097]|nr:ferredoxin [Nocardia sp. SYP-A9097]
MCVLIDATVFHQDEDGLVVIDDAAARAADPALLRHAVSCCPGQALFEDAAAPAKSSATQRE